MKNLNCFKVRLFVFRENLNLKTTFKLKKIRSQTRGDFSAIN